MPVFANFTNRRQFLVFFTSFRPKTPESEAHHDCSYVHAMRKNLRTSCRKIMNLNGRKLTGGKLRGSSRLCVRSMDTRVNECDSADTFHNASLRYSFYRI